MKRSDRKSRDPSPFSTNKGTPLWQGLRFACLTGPRSGAVPTPPAPPPLPRRRQSRFKFGPWTLAPRSEAARASLGSTRPPTPQARRAQRSFGCWVTRPLAVLPRGNKVSNSAVGPPTQCPPAEHRSALRHPLAFLSLAVATPHLGDSFSYPPPRNPSLKSLLPSLLKSP